jgi:2-keto-4-pentenoate hydratase/2-oxohepta-3-ene-1,7-dioic acid hydratase in catechol pathway
VVIAATSEGPARMTQCGFELLDVGGATLDELVRAGEFPRAMEATVRKTVPHHAVQVEPPVRPGKFVIVGLNYRGHAAEIGAELPSVPQFGYAPGSAVTGAYEDVYLPDAAPDEVDYEGELAVVIGRTAAGITEADAWSHVAGLTIANDVSARDVQLGHGRVTADPHERVGLAKGFETFKPLGPAMLTPEVTGPNPILRITTLVDDEIRQDATTEEFIFGLPTLISTISRHTTLDPGDVILTGTPSGIGMTSGRFLTEGQIVEVRIEGIGALRNRVVHKR